MKKRRTVRWLQKENRGKMNQELPDNRKRAVRHAASKGRSNFPKKNTKKILPKW